MSTSQALRDTAAYLLAQAAIMDGKPLPAGFDMNDKSTWWPAMIAQFDAEALPHAWRDWTSGMLPSDAGDNDNSPEMDELLRAFRPFCDALTREKQPDSTGAVFYVPDIKRRGGIGPQSVRLIRDEIRGKWYSAWGEAWRAHPLNAHLIPKPEVVDALFSKVYG